MNETKHSDQNLKEYFLTDIEEFNQYIEEKSLIDSENLLEEIKNKINEIPYLRQMLRKTEIYLRRHEKDLDESRKKEILINSIKKEIRFLKKGILLA